eukprot:TRINITY_DN67367_c0_g1_i1.p1 TRINITY_DN67367_c0_g1~~TRINITY_DN67367_c0_g1_i1.p1  ORF type:complete len:546 (+),score=53.95 TRINITY_DN67367_c0_g1_i1:35-1639(+)
MKVVLALTGCGPDGTICPASDLLQNWDEISQELESFLPGPHEPVQTGEADSGLRIEADHEELEREDKQLPKTFTTASGLKITLDHLQRRESRRETPAPQQPVLIRAVPTHLQRQARCQFKEATQADVVEKCAKKCHARHIERLCQRYSHIFPQSFVVTLLPLSRPAENVSEQLANLLLPAARHICADAIIRPDNLRLENGSGPKGAPSGRNAAIPVHTVLSAETGDVLCCVHVLGQEREEAREAGSVITTSFRSGVILLGPETAEPMVVRQILRENFLAQQGWVLCGSSIALFDSNEHLPVRICPSRERELRNALAIASTALRQLQETPTTVDIVALQEDLALSNNYGWPLPFEAPNAFLEELCAASGILEVVDRHLRLTDTAATFAEPSEQLSELQAAFVRLLQRVQMEPDDEVPEVFSSDNEKADGAKERERGRGRDKERDRGDRGARPRDSRERKDRERDRRDRGPSPKGRPQPDRQRKRGRSRSRSRSERRRADGSRERALRRRRSPGARTPERKRDVRSDDRSRRSRHR